MISYLSDAVDCLYDTYSNQTNRLMSYGYTKEEAFWIHFASVSFMPWSERARNMVPLSHILKFYAQVYRDEIIPGKNGISKLFLRCILKSKFDLAYALARQSHKGEPILKFAYDIGRCALPDVNDSLKHTLAGLFIINAMPVSQKTGHCLSLGRLVQDINNNYNMEKPDTSNYAMAAS
ncbi:MAG: hypothetical protein WBL85_01940 [Sedimentisphaerales bacterium]